MDVPYPSYEELKRNYLTNVKETVFYTSGARLVDAIRFAASRKRIYRDCWVYEYLKRKSKDDSNQIYKSLLRKERKSKIEKKTGRTKISSVTGGWNYRFRHHRRALESSLLLYTALMTLPVRIDSYTLSILLDFVC